MTQKEEKEFVTELCGRPPFPLVKGFMLKTGRLGLYKVILSVDLCNFPELGTCCTPRPVFVELA